jgi:MtN3 and saliva related transmembrane protein
LSAITFVPQVCRAWQTKSTGDLSVWMIIILLANVSAWLVYGIVKEDFAIILANSIILSLSLLVLYFKLTFKNYKTSPKRATPGAVARLIHFVSLGVP